MIALPFPPASLSGHNTGHWRGKADIVKSHREDAAEKAGGLSVMDEGDIHVHVTFFPPDRRGDRVNYPNRMKPYFDGIADALGVNDSRFVPHYYFVDPPHKPGRVEVRIGS